MSEHTQEPLAWLAERRVGTVATVGVSGDAHAVPVEVIVRDGLVYVWGQASSVKVRNAARVGRASFVAYKGMIGVLVRGAARVLDASDPVYAPVTAAFLAKYEREETYGNDALIQIKPERVSAF